MANRLGSGESANAHQFPVGPLCDNATLVLLAIQAQRAGATTTTAWSADT
jgi:hypothetical protein